ncbi:MAG: aminodeoxychorismate/anthranilate synthase component II [Candidatus Melainabacteria bacterium]|nr:aminodeoxychorismate/anthranilate synthase component II [Candidatus Melainabacteria bacterium]
MTVLLIDNYDSFTYNLYQMLQAELMGLKSDETVAVYRNDALDFQAVKALSPSRIVLSPGPGHPAEDRDFGVCRAIIQRQPELGCPILGVCLGHQGIAHCFGGQVKQAPEIVHGKTSMVEILQASALLEGVENPFQAMRYHSLIVDEQTLPEELAVTACESKEGLIMAMQHLRLPIYGVQFHPESIGTPQGARILRNFLEL